MYISPVKLSSVSFKNNNSVENNAKVDVNENKDKSSKNKVILYSLAGLAAIGLGVVLVNNMRKGKTNAPVDLPNPPANPPEPSASAGVGTHVIEDLTDEAKQILAMVDKKLHSKNEPISSNTIDSNILISTNKNNPVLARLNQWYGYLEKKSNAAIKKGKEIKAVIESRLKHNGSIDPELGIKIDADLNSRMMDSKTRSAMAEFYTKMAEDAENEAKILADKQAKKEAMLKLKAENPQEYARLKKERINAKKEAKRVQRAEIIARNTKEVVLPDGTKGIEVTIPTKAGNITRLTSESGTLLSETRYEPNKTIYTIYNNDSKLVYIYDKENHSHISKIFAKHPDGNYELIKRERANDTDFYSRTIERLSDGNTRITAENSYSKKVVIVDKKGNIISKDEISTSPGKPPKPPEVKVLADWYVNYKKLCTKYGVSVRECGAGGAWDHYYELCLRDKDMKAYEAYLSRRAYQARYNEKAKLAELLDKLEAGNLDVKCLTEDDIEILKAYLKNSSENTNSALNLKIAKLIKDFRNYQEELARQAQQIRQSQGILLNA